MAVLTNSLLIDFTLIALSIILLLKYYFNSRFKYWKNRGIPFVKPTFLFGNFRDNILSGKQSVTEILNEIYGQLKGDKLGGYFELHVPKLMILDPDLIYKILVKDFSHFHDRGMFTANVDDDPLTNNITLLEGLQWRHLRYKLSPVFTSGKLKGMFEQIYNCGEDLLKELGKYADSNEALEAKDVSSIFTSEVIASCAFGLQIKINKPEGKPFKEMVRKVFPTSRFIVVFVVLQTVYAFFSKWIGLRVFRKDVTDYFLNLSKETVKYRKQNDIKRNDFLQLLLDLKEREESNSDVQREEEDNEEDSIVNQLKDSSVYSNQLQDSKVMSEECLAASSFMFLFAGTEVSNALGLLLYNLSTNPEVQVRLQTEVDEVISKHGGYNYQAVKDMVYMDQVIQESFRMNPITGYLNRVCTIPYRIPDSDVVIEKGTSIVIPVWAVQNDPQYYPNPESFVPERFSGNNFKPSPTYLPFGDGPRICIAMRFAILEMKVCLARIMSQFHVRLSKKTLQPLQLDPHVLFPRVLGGMWVTVHRRTTT